MREKMKPIDHLTNVEKYLLSKIEEDIEKCKNESDLILLKNALDELLETSFSRYAQNNP